MEILERFDDGSVIALVELEKLHDHEQIKQDYLKKLTDEIKKDGEVKYPLIVDKYSYVVLDGHHRFYALKSLGCKYAPAHVIDYYDPHIKVERWYPVVKTRQEAKAVLKTLSNNGYIIEEVANEDVLKVLIDAGIGCIGLVIENESEEFFIAQKEYCNFEEAVGCIKKGLEIEGVRKDMDHVGSDAELTAMLKKKEARMAIITPHITKGKIVETGAKGKPMPPKTTRHIIPEKKYYPVSLLDLMGK